MRTIDSLDNLNIPNDYKKYITHYLSNLKRNKLFHHISKVILFGSCAREEVKVSSDIDIFLMTDTELKDDDELLLQLLDKVDELMVFKGGYMLSKMLPSSRMTRDIDLSVLNQEEYENMKPKRKSIG